MSRSFALDENILILALKRQDAHGNPDDTCLSLFSGAELKPTATA